MDDIIRNEANASFLQHAEQRGYSRYVDYTQSDVIRSHPGFYLGSVQKRIRDENGIRYLIDIAMFDNAIVTSKALHRLGTQVSVQFVADEEKRDRVSVSFAFEGFEEAEERLAKMWEAMEFGYYDRS
jgi:hypothetical protein